MSRLTVGILGLDRTGASFGLALKRHTHNGGRYSFDIVGYDASSANEKSAQKSGAVDRVERSPEAAVRERQIVLLNLPYDEVASFYRSAAHDLQDGVVILDASPQKQPSYAWASKTLRPDTHVIGVAPLLRAADLYKASSAADEAHENLFENAPFLITPSVDSVKEAIDLAYNIAYLIGAKPRFMDPADYDRLIAQTDQLPRLLGIALYYNLMRSEGWQDLQWLTNPAFALATHALQYQHPDALRDELFANRDLLAAGLDQMIATLTEVRGLLRRGERPGLEALLTDTSESYEQWWQSRTAVNWEKGQDTPTSDSGGMLGMFLGDALAKRVQGKK
jgi:prephenate dehydrogenase